MKTARLGPGSRLTPLRCWVRLLLSGFLPGVLALLPVAAFAVFPQQYCSISLSRQFAVYCTDNRVRFALAGAVEEIKTGVLSVLEQKDQWKAPIVINVQREDPTEPGAPVSTLQIVELDQGFKVELSIRRYEKDQERELLKKYSGNAARPTLGEAIGWDESFDK